ncbi:MAG TPA: ABC transporter ATP-binding protein [Chitinophagales bacterium]|nr:ABC transporter ATP-binding protein [Chitinophagales bacterium]
MTDAAIVVEGLSKVYSSAEQGSFNALDNISFSLMPGTTLALIGRNGSGKSTLLKILAGVHKPTAGHAVLRGKVASVLEIGSGFHPDLTGIENIYFYGSVMGFSRNEIKQRINAIIDFSGIGDNVYKPVRGYSSGMFVRLASAVIVSLPYDILILDEVIGMGDAAFRVQFSAKIDELVANGAAVIMASHNLNELFGCNSYLWLDEGKLKGYSSSNSILNEYDDFVRQLVPAKVNHMQDGVLANVPVEINHVQLSGIRVCNIQAVTCTHFEYDETICLEAEVKSLKSNSLFPFMFVVTHNLSNVIVLGTSYNFIDPTYTVPQTNAGARFMVQLPPCIFNSGTYSVDVYGFDEKGVGRRLKPAIVTFAVKEPAKGGFVLRGGKVPGIIRPDIKWVTIN